MDLYKQGYCAYHQVILQKSSMYSMFIPFLCWIVIAVSSQQCTNEGIEYFVELEKNATSEAMGQLQSILATSDDSIFANGTTEDALYSAIASSLNVTTETSSERNNFVEALNVITDSYFTACYGPESERPSQEDSQQLVNDFLTLLANQTDFARMRQIFGKLLCLNEFSSSGSNLKRAVDLSLSTLR